MTTAKSLNDRQKFLLRYMLRNQLTCARAGAALCRNRLLAKSGSYGSNLCLAGSAVLRSLARIGLVYHFINGTDRWAPRLFVLTNEGRKIAEELKNQ